MSHVPPVKTSWCFGRTAKSDQRRLLRAFNYLPATLAAPPASVDLIKSGKMPSTGLGMMHNDTLGCCTCAALGHAIQVWTAQGHAMQTVSDATVLKAYEQFCGYNPADPSTDQGGIETTVLSDWKASPATLEGHTLAAYATVDVKNHKQVQQAVQLFSGLYIGFEVPDSIFSSTIWDVPKTVNIVGGHAVYVCGYDAQYVSVISWGSVYRMTWAFWDEFVDESYALLSADQFLSPGKLDAAGFNFAQISEDLAQI